MAQVFYANILKSNRNVEVELEKSTGRLFINNIDAERDCSVARVTEEFVALSRKEYDELIGL